MTSNLNNNAESQSANNKPENSFSEVITGLLSGIEKERRIDLAKSNFEEIEPFKEDLIRALDAIKELNPEHFNLWADETLVFGGRANDILKDKLQEYLTSNNLPQLASLNMSKAVFLLKQYDFVDSHFTALIKQYEGWACSADKVRTITNRLLKNLVEGKPIVWNYNQEYTYHLPKEIFTNQEQILEFFDALYFLYYGKSEKFLAFFEKLPKGEAKE